MCSLSLPSSTHQHHHTSLRSAALSFPSHALQSVRDGGGHLCTHSRATGVRTGRQAQGHMICACSTGYLSRAKESEGKREQLRSCTPLSELHTRGSRHRLRASRLPSHVVSFFSAFFSESHGLVHPFSPSPFCRRRLGRFFSRLLSRLLFAALASHGSALTVARFTGLFPALVLPLLSSVVFVFLSPAPPRFRRSEAAGVGSVSPQQR